MTVLAPLSFFETPAYRQFVAFCDECRRRRCIGICYGPPGVGKTFSARQYAGWEKIENYKRYFSSRGVSLHEVVGSRVVFYSLPSGTIRAELAHDLDAWRESLRRLLCEARFRQREQRLEIVKRDEDTERQAVLRRPLVPPAMLQAVERKAAEARQRIEDEFHAEIEEIKDPTELIIIDEADRFAPWCLNYACDVFERQAIGVIILARPPFEGTLIAYPECDARIALAHRFEPLPEAEIRHALLQQECSKTFGEESVAEIVGIADGNFRRLYCLVKHIRRIMDRSGEARISHDIIAAAQACLPPQILYKESPRIRRRRKKRGRKRTWALAAQASNVACDAFREECLRQLVAKIGVRP